MTRIIKENHAIFMKIIILHMSLLCDEFFKYSSLYSTVPWLLTSPITEVSMPLQPPHLHPSFGANIWSVLQEATSAEPPPVFHYLSVLLAPTPSSLPDSPASQLSGCHFPDSENTKGHGS